LLKRKCLRLQSPIAISNIASVSGIAIKRNTSVNVDISTSLNPFGVYTVNTNTEVRLIEILAMQYRSLLRIPILDKAPNTIASHAIKPLSAGSSMTIGNMLAAANTLRVPSEVKK